jgi:transcriptional regulator of acetoin/glycerol metabolism
VLVVWSGAAPVVQAFRIPSGGLILGRELLENTTDDRISRQHARVEWRDKRFVVTDLGSRNGTYTGGHPLVDREVTMTPPSVVRTGRTVSVLLDDVRKFEGTTISSTPDAIVGPSTAPLWKELESIAGAGVNLVIYGEPGSGRGRLARGYARIRNRPEAVFNPTIQAVPLERVVGPNIETLVLEQVGKLGLQNVAALVKLLDTRPALRVVTTTAVPLDQLGISSELAARLQARSLVVPPLRERPDEMAFLVHDAVRGAEPALQIHSTLVEVCLLRPWPGNTAELLAEVGRCAHTVAAQGKNNIRGEDLDNNAGHLMVGAPTMNAAVQPTAVNKPARRRASHSE